MSQSVSTPAPVIAGIAAALPKNMVSSQHYDQVLGRTPGWLERLSGVAQRPVASDTETQEALGAAAGLAAMAKAGLAPESIDLMLFAAAVGRQPIPSTAPLIKREMGLAAWPFPAYDINATCLSCLTAMDVAALHIQTRRARHVLVVASEIASRALPWATSPMTAGLFGDGAAALVISADDALSGERTSQGPRIVGQLMETYAEGYDYCALRSGGTGIDFHQNPTTFAANAFFEMDGPQLYRLTFEVLSGFLDRLLAQLGWSRDEVNLVVPHQASPRALEHISRHSGFRDGVVFDMAASMGNLVAVSLPLALERALAAGRLLPGQKALMIGTSAGVSIGGIGLIG